MALKPVLPSGFISVSRTPYISTNTARVDTNGDDATGKVGDLTRPFKTVAVALAAFEALALGNANCVVLLNGNLSETLTTSLTVVTFIGTGTYASTAFLSLTLTNTTDPLEIVGIGVVLGAITSNSAQVLVVDITQAGLILDDITHTGGGNTSVLGSGASSGPPHNQFDIHAAGDVFVFGFTHNQDFVNIDAAGQDVTAYTTLLGSVTAANVTMNDSRFHPGGTLTITGTTTYNNALLNTLQLLNPLPAAPTDITGIIQTLADMGAWQQPL